MIFKNAQSIFHQHFNRQIRIVYSQRSTYVFGAALSTGTLYYLYFLETVPLSRRVRFNDLPIESELNALSRIYSSKLRHFSGKILPQTHPHSILVSSIARKLIQHIDFDGLDWKVHVIDDPNIPNAFVVSGGKVYVAVM